MDNYLPIIIGAAFTFVFGLLGLIYSYLKSQTEDAHKSIDDIKDKYATKQELKNYKDDHSREHDKQDKAIERLEKKIDKLMEIIIGGVHEK